MTRRLDHPLVSIWVGIIARCHIPSHLAYKHYGRRGIYVCRRWERFQHFAKDMGPRPSTKHSVERRNVNGPYSPKNCRWATAREQNRNTRRTIRLTHEGQRRPLQEWAERIGMNPITLATRIKRGWSAQLALTTPARVGQRVRTIPMRVICQETGIPVSTYFWRLQQGWTPHDALHTPPHNKTAKRT